MRASLVEAVDRPHTMCTLAGQMQLITYSIDRWADIECGTLVERVRSSPDMWCGSSSILLF